jgi:iron complex transport system substrate-binding protein
MSPYLSHPETRAKIDLLLAAKRIKGQAPEALGDVSLMISWAHQLRDIPRRLTPASPFKGGIRFSQPVASAKPTWMTPLLLSFLVGSLSAKVVTDEVGRKVELPDSPQRIISLAPSITETLFALGLEGRIAGVTDYCNFPEAAKQKPHIGGIINPNLERIIALKPDLLLVTTEANKAEILTQMAKFQIPVFATSPRSIEGVFQSIRLLGEATGTQDRAQELVNQLQARRQHVLDKVKGLNRPRVLILYDLNPIVAGGHHTYPTDLIQSAGGISITGELEQDWPRLNIEYIVEKDPEIIFVTEMPAALSGPTALSALSGWKLTSAVRQNKIYLLDDRVNHPSPRIIEALELLAKRIHPEAFEE